MIVLTQLWCILAFCLHSHWAGFLYPASVWVGDSPVLQYLLKCQLVKVKMTGLSTDDIYSIKQMEKGIRKLQVRE